MRIRAWYPIVAVVAISLLFAAISSTADAKRYYGACGGGTTLKDNIAGWKQHGVLDDVARSTGQKPGVDGPAAKIVKDNMVPVYLVKGTWVTNYTCTNGSFKRLGAKKYLPAGTKLWMPEKNAPAKGKSKYVKKAEQANCGNRATDKMLVKRKGHSKPKPKHKAKHTPKKSTPTGCNIAGKIVDAAGNCVDQSNSTKQDCEAKGNSWNSETNTCLNITVQVNCGNAVVVNGSNNTVNTSQGENCNKEMEYCVNKGGNWNGVTHVCTMPPGCTSECQPPVVPTAECTDFVLETNPAVNLGVLAHVNYSATNANLTNVKFDWGDGASTSGTSQNGSHVYAAIGTYTVTATLTFTTANGGSKIVTCSAKQVTPKDGTVGPGSGSGSTGGTSPGTSPGPGTGTTCRDPNNGGEPRPMYSYEFKDIAGYCRTSA